jgi:STE24 endopeptidase
MERSVVASASELFSEAEVERGRRYARPLYVVQLVDGLLALAVLAVLAWTGVGDALDRGLDTLPWWLEEPLFAAICLVAVALVTLPLSLWAGLFRERRFGLSTQTLGGWLGDRLKGLAVGVLLTGAALLGLAALVRAFPSWWPLLAGAAAAAIVVLLGFLAPVVLEPIFNRFQPLEDAELAGRLHALAERGGVPVRDVLVSDASRRTRKLNAYVSGLGATRRVVLFDTLVERTPAGQIEAVVAHELAHRGRRHVEKLTALAAVGAALAVAILWALLGSDAGEPRFVPHVLLTLAALQLATAPLLAWISRRYEWEADRFALELTRDPAAVEAVFRELAAVNLSDLAPPRLLHTLFAGHPTIPERVAAARSHGPFEP